MGIIIIMFALLMVLPAFAYQFAPRGKKIELGKALYSALQFFFYIATRILLVGFVVVFVMVVCF